MRQNDKTLLLVGGAALAFYFISKNQSSAQSNNPLGSALSGIESLFGGGSSGGSAGSIAGGYGGGAAGWYNYLQGS